MKKLLQIALVALIFSSCSNIIIPYYTTVDKITKVNPGMTKQEVVATLGISPYEVFHGIEQGCEIQQFKYKHKDIKVSTLDSYNTNSKEESYIDPSNLYVYYQDSKMESLVTDDGKKGGPMVLSFLNELQYECAGTVEAPLYGCMDKKSLNYNKKATAQRDGDIIELGTIVRIGDCEYCACDFKPNKKYDAKRECGERCIPIEKPKKKDKIDAEEIVLGPDCTLCDLADKENAQVHVDLIHKSGRLWNRKFKIGEYISKIFNKERKSNNKKSK